MRGIDDSTRFAGTRTGDDQHRPFRRGDGRFLGFVQDGKVEHGVLFGAGRSFTVFSYGFFGGGGLFDLARFAQAFPQLVDTQFGHGRHRHRLHAQYAFPRFHLRLSGL